MPLYNPASSSSSEGTVLDRIDVANLYTVPSTAVNQAGAVAVPGFTITPTCSAGIITVRAMALLNHGATGWSAGRFMAIFIGDATVSSTAPVVTSAQAVTHAQVTGANTTAYCEASYPIAAGDAGTRTFKLFAYVTNAALTAAFVYGDPASPAFIEAVVGG